ncbi:MAG: helix-turn-helix transcriptional regulator [Myxococcaceae bacterium]
MKTRMVPFTRFFETTRVRRVNRKSVAALPDGRTCLALCRSELGSELWVTGPRTRAKFKPPLDFELVVLPLKPGWASALLNVPAHELTDRVMPLEALWGRDALTLCDSMESTTSLEHALEVAALTLFTRALRSRESASARLVRQATHRIETRHQRLDDLARELGVTARHLRRAFLEHVGVGPRDFARSTRLQRVLALSSASRDLGRVALDAGYYDSSHFSADFRELVGLTPSEFFASADQRA